MNYGRQIRRLIKRIPTDFPCPPGCSLCCRSHGWTWTEWEAVENKKLAHEPGSVCPYASNDGCKVYELRPVICRLWGNCMEVLGDYRNQKNVSAKCPLGIEPRSPLTREEAWGIFREYMEIMRREHIDLLNDNAVILRAGPYGHFHRDSVPVELVK